MLTTLQEHIRVTQIKFNLTLILLVFLTSLVFIGNQQFHFLYNFNYIPNKIFAKNIEAF